MLRAFKEQCLHPTVHESVNASHPCPDGLCICLFLQLLGLAHIRKLEVQVQEQSLLDQMAVLNFKEQVLAQTYVSEWDDFHKYTSSQYAVHIDKQGCL